MRSQLIEAMGTSFPGNHDCYCADRLSRYRDLAPWLGDFCETEWFAQAIDVKVNGLKDSTNEFLSMFTMLHDRLYWKEGTDKEETRWCRFQEAIKEHQRYAVEDLDRPFNKIAMTVRQFSHYGDGANLRLRNSFNTKFFLRTRV